MIEESNEYRINEQTNIHETVENVYETNTKVNRRHRHGNKGGKGKDGHDINVESMEDDNLSENSRMRQRAQDKHTKVRKHEDMN
jgi:hypothetical protein